MARACTAARAARRSARPRYGARALWRSRTRAHSSRATRSASSTARSGRSCAPSPGSAPWRTSSAATGSASHHRPAAWVGFAHDATTRRTLFEAFVAVRAPFARRPPARRFSGKSPGTLRGDRRQGRSSRNGSPTRSSRPTSPRGRSWAPRRPPEAPPEEREATARDLPWTATVEEAIGMLGAGPDARGVFRVGGDLLVSRDALARLEARAPPRPRRPASARSSTRPSPLPASRSTACDRSTSVRDVIFEARSGRLTVARRRRRASYDALTRSQIFASLKMRTSSASRCPSLTLKSRMSSALARGGRPSCRGGRSP